MPQFAASLTRRAFNSLSLLSSDALTPLVYYIRKLCSHNLEIAQAYCIVSSLAAQYQDWCAVSGFEIVPIPGLCGAYIQHWRSVFSFLPSTLVRSSESRIYSHKVHMYVRTVGISLQIHFYSLTKDPSHCWCLTCICVHHTNEDVEH